MISSAYLSYRWTHCIWLSTPYFPQMFCLTQDLAWIHTMLLETSPCGLINMATSKNAVSHQLRWHLPLLGKLTINWNKLMPLIKTEAVIYNTMFIQPQLSTAFIYLLMCCVVFLIITLHRSEAKGQNERFFSEQAK